MAVLPLPVQFYGHEPTLITLDPATTVFMLVDCDGTPAPGTPEHTVREAHIAPALAAARRIGMRVFYFHEDAYGIGGPHDITRELHGERYSTDLPSALFDCPNGAPIHRNTSRPLRHTQMRTTFPRTVRMAFKPRMRTTT